MRNLVKFLFFIKKKIKPNALVLLLTLYSFGLISQDSLYQHSISFSMGSSHPYGKFKSTDISSNKSGYAKTGFHFLLDYNFRINYTWGINFNFLNYDNPIDVGKIESYYNAHATNGESYYIEKVDSNWNMGAGTIGVTFQTALDKKNKLFFMAKLAVGGASGYSPSYTLVKTEANGNVISKNIASSRGEIFFMNVGMYSSIEFGYLITKRFYTKLYICHLLKNEGLEKPFLLDGHSFNFSNVNLGIGLAYKFNFRKSFNNNL